MLNMDSKDYKRLYDKYKSKYADLSNKMRGGGHDSPISRETSNLISIKNTVKDSDHNMFEIKILSDDAPDKLSVVSDNIYCIKYINNKPLGIFDGDTYIDASNRVVTLQFFSFETCNTTSIVDTVEKYYRDHIDVVPLLQGYNHIIVYDYKYTVKEYLPTLTAFLNKKICFLTTEQLNVIFTNEYKVIISHTIPTLNTCISTSTKENLYYGYNEYPEFTSVASTASDNQDPGKKDIPKVIK